MRTQAALFFYPPPAEIKLPLPIRLIPVGRTGRAQVGLQSGPVRMEPQSGPVRSVVPLVRSGPVRGPLESGPKVSSLLGLSNLLRMTLTQRLHTEGGVLQSTQAP